jgi:nucleotide-binding universal stress UspA family protein
MTDHTLVPYDGSPQAEDALAYALEHPADRVTVLHVIDPAGAAFDSPMTGGPFGAEDWYENAKDRAEDLFDDAREAAAEADVELRTATEVGQPGRIVTRYAEDHDVDHIVMGSHGRKGVTRILLGSVAETVVRRAHCPVTVVR